MGLKKEIELYGGGSNTRSKEAIPITSDFMPVAGKRSSVPDVVNTFAPANKLQEIPHDFAVEYLATLENLAAYNDYFSYAVDNIIQLANTDHEIYFPDTVSAKDQKAMRLLLKSNEKKWYNNSSGISSLKADLLAQLVINGALSAEFIPDKKLEKIEKVVRVSPKYIVFVYDKTKDDFLPYQKSIIGINRKDPTGNIPLNTKTYKYIAIRKYFSSPYGVPPFISAIDSLCTQKGMDESFKNIMSKLGMLGFLSAEVSAPKKDDGESDTAYYERSIRYLRDVVAPQVEQNLAKGFVAGFKDKHSFKLEGNNMNVQGAEGLANLIKNRIFAGVKQDPNMLGHNEATTETFGRVILVKMLSQTADYQAAVDRFFEDLYLTELNLHGYFPDYIEVESKKPIVSDQAKEQDAESKKIDNVIKKRDAGIIDQQTAAQELDYDKPAAAGNINTPAPPNNDPIKDNGTDTGGGDTKGDNSEEAKNTKALARLFMSKYKDIPTYDYTVVDGCFSVDTTNFMNVSDFKDKQIEKFIKKYFNAVYAKHKEASKKIAKRISAKLLNVPETDSLLSIQNLVYYELLAGWSNDYVNLLGPIVEDNISDIWEFYRKDSSIFGGGVTVQSNVKKFSRTKSKDSYETVVPEGVLDLTDFRAIQYMEDSDILYLGKYITDPDVKAKVFKYVEENYIDGYLPIGNNDKAIDKFISTFSDDLNLVGWKIRRILDTTVNKVRNYAHIHYLEQASIDRYEVIEVLDELTCGYCSHMDGKVFTVSNTKEKISREVAAGPGEVSTVSPFLTTLKLKDVQKMTATELQNAGHNVPSYHPHCRGTIGAVFDDE